MGFGGYTLLRNDDESFKRSETQTNYPKNVTNNKKFKISLDF